MIPISKLYKLREGSANNLFDPIATVFNNRGVNAEEAVWFENPTPVEYDTFLMKNMDKAIDLVMKHKDGEILIQIDKDADGFTSASLLYMILKKHFPNLSLKAVNHSQNRKHGIDLSLIDDDTTLFIYPDGGSNDFKEHKELEKKGIDVLILDHHPADRYSNDALVVNPYLDDYPNKEISGVGVVYKFAQALDEKMGTSYANHYLDLVSVGMIGDSMNTGSKETRWLIQQGLKNIKNEFLQEMFKENFKDSGVTMNGISFKVLPKINATIRVGTTEELDRLFMAFCEHQEISYNKRLKSENKYETFCRAVTRECNNLYAKQIRIRDKVFEMLNQQIEENNLDQNEFIVVTTPPDFIRNMSGYVAIALVQKYNKPAIVLFEREDGVMCGSVRGHDDTMRNTKTFLKSLNIFEFNSGHENAHGVGITKENLAILNETLNKAMENYNSDDAILVDFEAHENTITPNFVTTMEKYSHLWAKGLEPPLLGVTTEVNATDLMEVGKKGGTVKFSKNGVEYITFKAQGLTDYLNKDKLKLKLEIVGKTGVNKWKDNVTPQIVIESYQVINVEETATSNMFGGWGF